MNKITKIQSTAVPLPIDNIDTDQILPAKYLLKTDKLGYGEHLFENWRYEADGRTPNPKFILNDKRYDGAQILISGESFGAGSSREHAVWAIMQYGFKAVIAPSFSDIFRNNSYGNGLLLIELDANSCKALIKKCTSDPKFNIVIDLPSQRITSASGEEYKFEINSFIKDKLLKGQDDIGYILSLEEEIREYERKNGK